MSLNKKYGIPFISRFVGLSIIIISFILLIFARFQIGPIIDTQFQYYYFYIIVLLCFLMMFRFSIKTFHCRKLMPVLGNIVLSGVVFLLSPLLLKIFSFIIIVCNVFILKTSQEYIDAKKKAIKNGIDTDSLC